MIKKATQGEGLLGKGSIIYVILVAYKLFNSATVTVAYYIPTIDVGSGIYDMGLSVSFSTYKNLFRPASFLFFAKDLS